jgi:Tol biopolymer transport system component
VAVSSSSRPTPGEDYEPVWSADGSEILFTSNGRAEATHGILIMGSDGSDVRLLSAHPLATSGGLSPNRNRVTYVDGLGDVYVSALDGSAAQLVAAVGVQQECPGGIHCNRYATHPRWSPDGSSIAFVVISEGRGGSRYGDLRLVRSDGTGFRSIGGGPESVLDPEWSPDGTRIVVFSNIGYGGTNGNAWVYLVAAGTWKVATPYANQFNEGKPLAVIFGSNWSPGGKDLVYSTYRGDPADSVAESALWKIPSGGGGTPRRIHAGIGLYGTPAWRPGP